MNTKGFPLRWLMSIMSGARNRQLKTLPDGGAVQVFEGSSSEEAILGVAPIDPRPVTRKPACHAMPPESKKKATLRQGRRSWVGLDD